MTTAPLADVLQRTEAPDRGIDPDMAMLFLEYVRARHGVWTQRQAGAPAPWASDPIVASRKFTNVYRVLDPGTQFLLTDLFPGTDPRTALMRAFLYRHTGRIEVWQHLRAQMGAYPTHSDLTTALQVLQAYRDGAATRRTVFTGAYLVSPQGTRAGSDKLASIVDLTQRLFTPGSPEDIVPDFMAATTQSDRFGALRRNLGVADFMSMQVLTDWGYSQHVTEDLENAFVVPGPGARKGAKALAPGARPMDTLAWALEAVWSDPDGPLLQVGRGRARQPSAMDVQNCLCEFSKYVRLLDRDPATLKPYRPANPGAQPAPIYPAHW